MSNIAEYVQNNFLLPPDMAESERKRRFASSENGGLAEGGSGKAPVATALKKHKVDGIWKSPDHVRKDVAASLETPGATDVK